MEQTKLIDFDERIIPEDEAHIPVNARAVVYGEGVFETMRVYYGQFLRLSKHLKRLYSGMRQLGMDPGENLEEPKVRERIINLLAEREMLEQEVRVRLRIGIKNEAQPDNRQKPEYFSIITAETAPETGGRCSLMTSQITRTPSSTLDSGVKWTQYLSNMQALRTARKSGFDDALMLTSGGLVGSTAIANIFWIRDSVVFTPSASCDILPGITRSVLIDGLKLSGITVKQGKYKPQELKQADLVFLTNSIREVVWVEKIDDRVYPVKGPLHETVSHLFERRKSIELE